MNITCILPCYNEERTIVSCLRSILNQSLPVSQIVVCDDGSTDATTTNIKEALSGSSAVWKIQRLHENLGLVRNFRRCLQATNSEFLLFCAANDIFDPDHVENLARIHANDPQCVLAYGHCRFLDDQEACRETSFDFSNVEIHDRSPAEGFVEAARTYHRATPLWGLYRTEALRAVNPFRFYPTADAVFIAELATVGNIRSTAGITWTRYFPYARTRESLYRLTGPRPSEEYVSPWVQFPTIHRIQMMYRAFYEASIPGNQFEGGLLNLAQVMENRWKKALHEERKQRRKRLAVLSREDRFWMRDEIRSVLRFHERLLRKP